MNKLEMFSQRQGKEINNECKIVKSLLRTYISHVLKGMDREKEQENNLNFHKSCFQG